MQKLLLYICITILCTQCAQITPLTGGKKDAEPPKVVKSQPKNASINFSSKEIDIQFDEYITLKDITNQFIITPQTKELPDIEASGKKIKIKFNESLLPNTTYKLSFGNAITDLRESNSLQNFEYIFSTGTTIDSLTMNGQIINAFDKKPAAQILVALYPSTSNDSIIYKDKPLYISKTNDNGEFKFNYLSNTYFKIIGIKDQNKNLLYDGSDEQVAFADSIVSPNRSLPVTLFLFKELASKSFIKKTLSAEYGKAYLIFNKPQADLKDIRANGLISYSKNNLNDSITLYYDNIFDTLQTFISYNTKKTDTIYIRIPSLIGLDRIKKNQPYKYNLSSNISSADFPFYELPVFGLNVPVEASNINERKIVLSELKDTSKINKPYRFLSTTKSVSSFTLQCELKPEANYRLIFYSSAFTNTQGRINDSIAYAFKTTSPDDYAQLQLKLLFPEKENYIVFLLNEKEQIVRTTQIEFSLNSSTEKNIEYTHLLPGSYFIKIVEDTNKNGAFDSGNYFLHQQPETIFINTKPIKLLAGWEIENEWIVK